MEEIVKLVTGEKLMSKTEPNIRSVGILIDTVDGEGLRVINLQENTVHHRSVWFNI